MQLESNSAISVTIHLRAVWIALRFRCKLSFMLKNEQLEVMGATDSAYPLVKGQAIINDHLSFKISKSSLAKAPQFRLIVVMSSANGIVPAGFATFSLPTNPQLSTTTMVLPLQRCQDDHAQIKFTISFDNDTILKRPQLAQDNNSNIYSGISAKDSKVSKQRNSKSPYQKLGWLSRQSNSISKNKNLQLVKEPLEHSPQRIRLQTPSKQVDCEQPQVSKEDLLREHRQYWLEIVRLESALTQLRQSADNIKNENEILRSENQNLRLQAEKVYALVSEVEQRSAYACQLQGELAESKKLSDDLQKKSCIFLSQKQAALAEIQSLKGRLQDLLKQEESLVSLKQLYEQMEGKNNQLYLANEQLKSSLDGAESEISLKDAQLAYLKVENQQQTSRLQKQLAELLQQQSKLQDNLTSLTTHKRVLEQQKQQINSKLQNQVASAESLKKENLSLREDLISSQLKLSLTTDQKSQLSQQLGAITCDIENLKGQCQRFRLLVQKESAEKQRLAESLANREQMLAAVELKMTQLQSSLKAEVELKTQAAEMLSFQLNQAERQRDEANSMLQIEQARFQSQKAQLLQQLKTIEEEKNKNELLLKEYQAELEMAQDELAKQTKKLQEQDYSSSYNRSMTQLTFEHARLQREKNDLQSELERVGNKLARVTEQLNQTKNEGAQREEILSKQLAEVKAFAHSQLRQIIQLRKEKGELQGSLKDLLKE